MKAVWAGFSLGAALMMSAPVFAATYSVTGSCVDPTPTGAGYTPAYDWEVRVNWGTSVPTNDSPTCAISTTVTAIAGQTIEARVRNKNTQGPIVGTWTAWYSAVAPVVVVTPQGITGVVITVSPQ